MRKKLLLSCLSAIALAALGIGANADIFKPYERYEVPVETLDVIEEVKEDSVKADETAVEAVDKEIVADENQKTKAQAFSSEGKKEEKQNADNTAVHEEKSDSIYEPPKEIPTDKPSSNEPAAPKPDPAQAPDFKPVEKPSVPDYACPAGMDPNKPCDVIMDTSFYYATYSSQSEADSAGQYFLDDVVTIGDKEITNYSVQPVYRNDGSVAYYGLNLWNYGSLIQ